MGGADAVCDRFDFPHPETGCCVPEVFGTELTFFLFFLLFFWVADGSRADEHVPVATQVDRVRLRSMNVAGISLLSHLEEMYPLADEEEQEEEEERRETTVSLVVCLSSFTDPRDQWSGPEASQLAHLLLSTILQRFRVETKRLQALIAVLLKTRVKPLFAKSRNPTVTAQGRKAIDPAPTIYMVGEAESEIKPWKFQHVYIVTVFRWILQNLDV